MVAAVAYQRPQNAGGTTLRASKKPHVVLTVLDDAGYDDLWSSSDLAAAGAARNSPAINSRHDGRSDSREIAHRHELHIGF